MEIFCITWDSNKKHKTQRVVAGEGEITCKMKDINLRLFHNFFPDIKGVSLIVTTGKIKPKMSWYPLQCILTTLDPTTFKS